MVVAAPVTDIEGTSLPHVDRTYNAKLSKQVERTVDGCSSNLRMNRAGLRKNLGRVQMFVFTVDDLQDGQARGVSL